MIKSMMSHTELSISFWGYALNNAILILNKVPSKSVQQTPYNMDRDEIGFLILEDLMMLGIRQTFGRYQP